MARRLARNVGMRAPTGEVRVFLAGEEVPGWAADRIDPSFFEGDADAAVEAPPRAGKGSGRDEWAAYAASLGVDVDDDAGRDDIIAAVEAAQK